ncbi:MAG: glycosyltransferase family 2 protein [Vicinamibacteria bacterium]|nr:glycosyltransferase family 2 protein [Vicinamibacteria bacterium]
MTTLGSDGLLELSVVVPVHNEAARIREVVAEWDHELRRLGLRFELRLYDDGSTDDSRTLLETWPQRPASLVLLSHPNRGHGPTLLRGYGEARGAWLLQVDGDGEIGAAAFEPFWRRRDEADLLLGVRSVAHLSAARRQVSAAARLATWMLFGARLRDVNVPFRLIRSETLHALLPSIPPSTFAPNVALAGLAVARGLRVVELPVPVARKASATGALRGLRLWRTAWRALVEIVVIAIAARRERRGR